MLQYIVNKCVFDRRLKPSLLRSGSLKLSGREFQSDGPATEKAGGPSVLSRHLGVGTTKRRRVADRRCCRAETSDTGTQRSARYRRDWPCKQLYIATPSLYWTLSGWSRQWSSECKSREKPESTDVPVLGYYCDGRTVLFQFHFSCTDSFRISCSSLCSIDREIWRTYRRASTSATETWSQQDYKTRTIRTVYRRTLLTPRLRILLTISINNAQHVLYSLLRAPSAACITTLRTWTTNTTYSYLNTLDA